MKYLGRFSLAAMLIGTLLIGGSLSARQSTQLAPHLNIKLDSSGYLYVTGTGAGSGQGTSRIFTDTYLKTDASGYLKVNCAAGCGGGVGGSANDVQCNVASALGACDTGNITVSSSTMTIYGLPIKTISNSTFATLVSVGGSGNMMTTGANDAWQMCFGCQGNSVQGAIGTGSFHTRSAGTVGWSATANAVAGDDVQLTRSASHTLLVSQGDGSTPGTINVGLYKASGSSGLTGTACTAFTGGICTAGSVPAAANDVLRSDLDALTKEVVTLRAIVDEQQRQMAALLASVRR